MKTNRYWVSWWTKVDPGQQPFTAWITGFGSDDKASLCAVMDAPNEASVWNAVDNFFPGYSERFCEQVKEDYSPSDRFPGPFSTEVPIELWLKADVEPEPAGERFTSNDGDTLIYYTLDGLNVRSISIAAHPHKDNDNTLREHAAKHLPGSIYIGALFLHIDGRVFEYGPYGVIIEEAHDAKKTTS